MKKQLTVTRMVEIDGKRMRLDELPIEKQLDIADKCKVAIAEMETGQRYTIEKVG